MNERTHFFIKIYIYITLYSRAVLFTNQNVTACQAHGVTRNEPKIHGICYITLAYYDVAGQQVSHYVSETPPIFIDNTYIDR